MYRRILWYVAQSIGRTLYCAYYYYYKYTWLHRSRLIIIIQTTCRMIIKRPVHVPGDDSRFGYTLIYSLYTHIILLYYIRILTRLLHSYCVRIYIYIISNNWPHADSLSPQPRRRLCSRRIILYIRLIYVCIRASTTNLVYVVQRGYIL